MNLFKQGENVFMYVVTYSLKENDPSSDIYYRDVDVFTDEVLSEAGIFIGPILKSYETYNAQKGENKVCSKEEYILELLVLGILWKVYSGDALGLGELPRSVLTSLSKLRQERGNMKSGIDFLRGILATLFLSPDLYDNMFTLEPKVEYMEKLLNWLDATGEFKQEVKRLKKWYEFLSSRPSQESSDIIAKAISLAVWFEVRSEEMLGRYTANVERFLNEIRPGHYWHEDVIFCGRRRVEYHLNMVGAEIMNRVFRDEFLNTAYKMVILPACMCLLPHNKCKMKETSKGYICAGCTSQCKVNQLADMGKEYGFKVVIVPHESSLSNNQNDIAINKDFGVVGIACVLNLISGGWMLRERNIAPQCVLLDYCGCRKHWHSEGMPTEINVNQIKRVLGIK